MYSPLSRSMCPCPLRHTVGTYPGRSSPCPTTGRCACSPVECHPQQQAGLQISLTAGMAPLKPPVEAPASPQVHAAAFCPAVRWLCAVEELKSAGEGETGEGEASAHPNIHNSSTLFCPQHNVAWTWRSSNSHPGNFCPFLFSISNTDK